MSVEIQVATPADRERVLALLRAQFDEHSIRPADAALEQVVERLQREPALGRLLVARLEGEVVGVAAMVFNMSLEHGGRLAWLDELYVEPAYRGRGLGVALVRAARDLAASDGAVVMELEIEAGHERVARLYEREGFRPLERQPWMRRLEPAASVAAPEPAREHTGGCLCGAVRYRASNAPFDVSHCHCGLCRRSTGAPFVTWATFPAAAFSFTQGVPRERASTPGAVRSFCAQCGTALTFREVARPNSVDVTAGSLDAPEAIAPLDHTFAASMLRWLSFADTLPRFAGTNPGESDYSVVGALTPVGRT